MAKCKVDTVTVMKPVEEKEYTLTLNQEEAEFIKSFLGICAGSYKIVQGLYDALDEADVLSRTLIVKPECTVHRSDVLDYIYLVKLGDCK